MSRLADLLAEVRACRICEDALPHGPRPVVQGGRGARVLIAGQAPGRRVHASGKPFDDPSGVRLREWMGVDEELFYDPDEVAIVPMGFCYPGTGSSGDLPPRPECAETWRERLLAELPEIRLTLLVGSYAVRWHLDSGPRKLEEVVREVEDEDVIPLPHPSPRNNLWLRRNPWFETETLPRVRRRVAEVLGL